MSYVTVEKRGRAGVIGLDRPGALNALDLSMIEDIATALDRFETDPTIELVILRSNHDRAFCAGGDMRRIRELSMAGNYEEAEHFFRTEYALNLRIASYSKPYISMIDGICMGGGLGLTIHGKYRIASENAVFAMPEVAIGFFPDVGASYFLSRMPHHAGYWMGLTGARVKDFDAHALGLSTHMTSAVSLGDVFDALCYSQDLVDIVLQKDCTVLKYQSSIVNLALSTLCFKKPTICSINESLVQSTSSNAKTALQALQSASPRSLFETLHLLKRGAGSTLNACLKREFRAAQHAIRHPDLAEGVRAILIDKDHSPVWQTVVPDHTPTTHSFLENPQPQAML
jgi:enoyl-CoA hydratase/carnithine racemase